MFSQENNMSRPEYLDKILTKEVLEQSYAELGSLKAVARKFDLDPGSIKKYMIRCGLNFKPQVRHECDHNFFSRENEETFYIAGFIAADGCVKDRKSSSGATRPEMAIGLSKEDKSFLEQLRQLMKAEVPIRDFIVKNSKRNPEWNDTWKSDLVITSQKICDDLKRFNIVPRKSLIYTFPNWMKTHPLKHHFIRGYNDGDGSFYIPKLKDGREVEQVYFSMRGTPAFLKVARDILEAECHLEERHKCVRISSGHGVLEYGGNGVISKIADYLYKDATIYLPRKREIAMIAKQFQETLK
jgi:intein-encoded DNA endonuclease-like protein